MADFPVDTHDAIKAFIEDKSWDFQVYNGHKRVELKIQVCPFCGNNKYNFEINASNGLYRCWACNAHGSFASLQRHMGEGADGIVHITSGSKKEKKKYKTLSLDYVKPMEEALWADTQVLAYLMSDRGLTEDTIRHFHIGLAVGYGGEAMIALPHMRGDTIALLMYRALEEAPNRPKYIREADMESVLFHEDALYDAGKTIIVCEGQIDAMSVWQAGHANVVSVSTGAGTDWPDEWVDLLSGFDKIIMMFDGDKAGQSGIKMMHKRLGEDRVFIVHMPEDKDANDVLASEGPESLTALIHTARPAPIPGMVSISEGIAMLQDEELGIAEKPVSLPWFSPYITKAVGDPEEGDLVEINGAPGTGKTTLILQEMLYLAAERGIGGLITCFEMTTKKLARKIVQSYYQVPKEEVTLERLSDAIEKLKDVPLYFATPTQEASIDYSIKQATSAFKRFGIRAWVVDNLIILSEGAREPLREQAVVTRKLKEWARYYDNVCYLLTHPRKVESGHVEGLNDMRGSGAITANADIVVNIHRRSLAPDKEEDLFVWNSDDDAMGLLDPLTAVYAFKARDSNVRIGWLYFHGEYSWFRNATKDDFIDAQKRLAARNDKVVTR